MAKLIERGGVRLEFTKKGIKVFVDPAKLLAADEIPQGEFEAVSFTHEDVKNEARRFFRNISDEFGRIKRRGVRLRKKKKGS